MKEKCRHAGAHSQVLELGFTIILNSISPEKLLLGVPNTPDSLPTPPENAKARAVKRFSILQASWRRPAAGAAAVFVIAGCTTGTTNLTPRTVPAQPDSIYAFEVQWESPRRGSTSANVDASVMVDARLFPMSRVPGSVNRWEAAVPLPAGETYVPYKYKFDYWYPGLGRLVITNSEWSPEYRLVVPAR